MEQRTLEWYKTRLGKVTSSMVSKLMSMPTKKAQADGEVFSETAKTYLFGVASERLIKPSFLDDDFGLEQYLDRVNIETRDMRYGTETEEVARMVYSSKTGNKVEEVGFVDSPTEDLLGWYGDSPDGIVTEESGEKGCLEIKCPKPATFIKYLNQFRQGKELIDIEEDYYWQVQSHIYCNQVDWCDFVIFDKMLEGGFLRVRIYRNDIDIEKMLNRIAEAKKFITEILAE